MSKNDILSVDNMAKLPLDYDNYIFDLYGTLVDICTKEDLDWVKNFYNRIITGSDPFTIIRNKLEEEARRAKQQEQARKAVVSNQPKST